jgi:hypothetical protein
MPFNVNMGQGLGTAMGGQPNAALNAKLGVPANALNVQAGLGNTMSYNTPNTMFPPRPADMGMNMMPPTQNIQGAQTPGIINGQSFGPTGPGILPPNAVGAASKAQQLAHVLKGMGG